MNVVCVSFTKDVTFIINEQFKPETTVCFVLLCVCVSLVVVAVVFVSLGCLDVCCFGVCLFGWFCLFYCPFT